VNNPTTDKLTLSFSANTNQSIEIKVYDLSGRLQMNQKMNIYQGSNLISLQLNSSFKAGMYAVEVNNGSERQTAKFVKQ
jgi:myo-inositol-hexaphosphate 3-phosphohydrolase